MYQNNEDTLLPHPGGSDLLLTVLTWTERTVSKSTAAHTIPEAMFCSVMRQPKIAETTTQLKPLPCQS